jgi:hypothetical protein
MELSLDKVPLRVEVLFLATVLGVLALFVLGVRGAAQRMGIDHVDLWTVRAASGSAIWLAATGLLALTGILRDFSLPPKILGLFLVSMALTCTLAFSRVGTLLVAGIGPVGLIGFQFFRLPVEIFLRGMYQAGQAPVQMTYAGLNFDIFAGLTAPAMAWLIWRQRMGRYSIWAWNVLGLVLLTNIVTIAVLSMPTEFQVFMIEPANTFVTYVPYVWLPAVLVQAALLGHLLVFRWLWGLRKEA